MELAQRQLDRVQAAWDPPDWADLSLYGFYALEAAVEAASVHCRMDVQKAHWARAAAAETYGDVHAPELNAEDVAARIEAFIDSVGKTHNSRTGGFMKLFLARWRTVLRLGGAMLAVWVLSLAVPRGGHATRIDEDCNTYYNWYDDDWPSADDPLHTTHFGSPVLLGSPWNSGYDWHKFGENHAVIAYGATHDDTMVEEYTLASQEHWQDSECTDPT